MLIKTKTLNSICRICLRKNIDLISIKSIKTIEVCSNIILQGVGVDILQYDGILSFVCKCCSDELSLFNTFLEKCRVADEKLKKILDKCKPAECHSNDEGSFASEGSKEVEPQRKKDVKKKKKRSYTCELCGKSLSSASSLRVHHRSHSGALPFPCNICGRRFTQHGSLVAHTRRHNGVRPYHCSVCPASFTEHTHLRRHASVHTTDRPHTCGLCGKGLKTSAALKQHVSLHSASKEHVCEMCGASFTTKGNLTVHTRTRHSERSGQCDICARSVADLKTHMVKHTGERAHACNTCGLRFAARRGLQVHERRHMTPSFRCPEPGCERSFHKNWVMECHLLKHKGETPFVCKICSKGFFRLCHLTKHSKVTHPNENC